MHVSVPPVHTLIPMWQGLFGGGQLMPAMQVWHCPSSQNMLAPHGVPFITLVPLAPHMA
jgi:hypothetical protein